MESAATALPEAAAPLEASNEDEAAATADMTKHAAMQFQARRYSDCLETLEMLRKKNPDDPKILHNIAIVAYHQNGSSDPKKLLNILDNVKKQSDELARASREQYEAVNANCAGNCGLSGSRENAIVLSQLSASRNGILICGEEFDTSIIAYNTALILYNIHNFVSAASVLEPVYQQIDRIDEIIALRVCFLLLDVRFALREATQAADIIQYLERLFEVSSKNKENDCKYDDLSQYSSQPKNSVKSCTGLDTLKGSAPDSAKLVTGIPDVSTASDPNSASENCSGVSPADEVDNFAARLDVGSHNFGRALSDYARTSPDHSAIFAELKVKLQYYKFCLSLLTRNHQSASREIEVVTNMTHGRDSTAELFLKSQLEYVRGDYGKAAQLMSSLGSHSEHAILAMLYNNLGCILLGEKSYHTSSWFFSKALGHSSAPRAVKPLKIPTVSHDRSWYIMYNSGLQYLLSGKPVQAARCFREALPLFYNKPLYWLRFSECSILALEKGLLSSTGAGSVDGKVDIHVVGSGKRRHLSLFSDTSMFNGVNKDGKDNLISLKFARQCLQNALVLLEYSDHQASISSVMVPDAKDVRDAAAAASEKLVHNSIAATDSNLSAAKLPNGGLQGPPNSNAPVKSSISFYEQLQKRSSFEILQAVLANLAFIELSVENPLKALSFASSLQQLPNASKMYVFLARVYGAEALCLLNRTKEAADQLSPYFRDEQIELPFSSARPDQRFPEDGEFAHREESYVSCLKPEEALGLLYVNFSVVSAVQGDPERASHFIKRGLECLPDHPRAVMAAVYVDLLQGRPKDALPRLRECRSVRFRPNGLKPPSR